MNTPFQLMTSAVAATGAGWVARGLARSAQPADDAKRLPQAAPTDELSFPSRDGRAQVHAKLFLAERATSAVVIVVGQVGCWGSDASVQGRRLHVRTLAQALHARGVTVLVARLRGHGEDERHDVLGAVDYLLARGYRAGRIGVLGASVGASAALLAAAEEPSVCAVVADSPRTEAHAGARPMAAPGPVLSMIRWVGRELSGVDLGRRPVLGSLDALRDRAVLIIQGRGDRVVSPAVAQQLAKACGAQLWLTASRSHAGTLHEALPLYITRVVDFFSQHLLPQRSEPVIVRAPALKAASTADETMQAGLAPLWSPAAA